jgi:hypothetical protein
MLGRKLTFTSRSCQSLVASDKGLTVSPAVGGGIGLAACDSLLLQDTFTATLELVSPVASTTDAAGAEAATVLNLACMAKMFAIKQKLQVNQAYIYGKIHLSRQPLVTSRPLSELAARAINVHLCMAILRQLVSVVLHIGKSVNNKVHTL